MNAMMMACLLIGTSVKPRVLKKHTVLRLSIQYVV